MQENVVNWSESETPLQFNPCYGSDVSIQLLVVAKSWIRTFRMTPLVVTGQLTRRCQENIKEPVRGNRYIFENSTERFSTMEIIELVVKVQFTANFDVVTSIYSLGSG